MNEQPQKTRVVKEIPPEWVELMNLVEKIKSGQLIIKIQEKKILLVEYTIKRKMDDKDEFVVFPL